MVRDQLIHIVHQFCSVQFQPVDPRQGLSSPPRSLTLHPLWCLAMLAADSSLPHISHSLNLPLPRPFTTPTAPPKHRPNNLCYALPCLSPTFPLHSSTSSGSLVVLPCSPTKHIIPTRHAP